MRIHPSITVLLALCAAASGVCQQPGAAKPLNRVLVEDFEAGIGAWFTNDDEAAGQAPATKCAIYAVAGGAPEGGAQSGRIEFERSRSGWASVSRPVDGRKWAEQGCSTLSFWIRGDGSGELLRVVLRVQTTRPKRDEAYSQILRLDSTNWEQYSLRSFGFKDSAGKALAPEDIQHIRLLQFAKNGGWGAFKFRVDQISVEAEADAPEIPAPVAGTPHDSFTFRPDFGKSGPYNLAQVGVNLGLAPTVLENESDELISGAFALVSDLSPSVVRLELNAYFDPATRSYDLQLLDEHVHWVRLSNCKPVICLGVPPAPAGRPDLREKYFAEFVKAVRIVAARRAKEGKVTYYEVFDEPLLSGAFADADHVASAYNSVVKLILAAHPAAKVGGPGFSSAWDDHVESFLKQAQRLDFLSFHFYGAHAAVAQSESLFEAAYKTRTSDLPHQIGFQQVKALAKKHCKLPPEIFVTEFALNSARDESGDARDERASGAFGAGWLAAAVLSGSPYVDKVILHQLKPGGWGLIGASGKPETAYWAAWFLAKYAPRGSVLQQIELLEDNLTLAALVKTKSAHNVFLARVGSEPVEVQIAPLNAPRLSEVRYRAISETDQLWQGSPLATVPAQTILLDGPGVTVVQYVASD